MRGPLQCGQVCPIRILLVDDHGLFRESLGRLLEVEPDFRIIGSHGSASEALRSNELESIDMVLLDYDLGEERAGTFLEEARAKGFKGRILMVTAGMSPGDTWQVFQSGISGIFLKHNPPSQLIDAIRQVMNGATWLDDRAVKAMLAGASAEGEKQNASQAMSERDRAILKALFEGLTNKEIAARLSIPETSVKWGLQQLFEKTGVRTRSQLVRIALEQGVEGW
jgi:DNA-binding NarL/FixJ family response regulator